MNKPKIRFKGFEGEWKEKALGDVVDEFKYGINAAAVSYDGENKYLRITDIDEGSRAFIKDELASPDADLSSCNEYIMQDGDIVIARTGASVGKSYIYRPIDGKVYFAGFLIRARVNKKVDREFVFQNTLTDGFKKYIRFVSQRSGQPGVNAEELKSYLMNLPASLPEQRALASYFTSLDAQIAASTSRLSSLKQIKAASLLNMFPQKGETVPRVRFKGFQGEWKRREFGLVFEYQRNNNLSRAELSDEGIVANIHYGDVLIKYGECLDVSKDVLTYVKDEKIGMALYKKGALRNGDIIFADAAEDNTVGKCTEVICEENMCIVSGLHTIVCRPQVEVVERYLGYSLNSPSFHDQLLPHIQGTKISSISKNALLSTSISLPSLPEQRAIASYFTALDAQITLHRERLEKLKQIKAACLDKMFA